MKLARGMIADELRAIADEIEYLTEDKPTELTIDLLIKDLFEVMCKLRDLK